MKKVLTIGVAALTSALTAALVYRNAQQRSLLKRTKLNGRNAIDETILFNVFGTVLKGLVRGTNKRNPVLLMIHGGPGTPDAMVARDYDSSLVNDFVVVRYDQRGTGRSRLGSVPIKRHTIELYMNDALRVAKTLRRRFPNQPLLLLGNSWGSIIGMKMVLQYPELFDAYIGVAQVINMQVSDPMSYDYALTKATAERKHRLVKRLQALNRDSFYLDYNAMREQRSVLFQVGGVMVRKETRREMITAGLRSPDYTLVDLLRTLRNATPLGKRLYPQMALTNLFDEIAELKVPVFFIEGSEDRQVSPQLVQQFMDRLRAPFKKFLWVNGAAHFFDFEKPNAFHRCMVDVKETMYRIHATQSASNKSSTH